MARKPKIQTRVERDTKDAIDAYVDDHEDVSQSEAVRHLIRAGLAEKGYPVAAADGGGTPLERLATSNVIFPSLLGSFVALSAFFATYLLHTTGDTIPALVTFVLSSLTLIIAGGGLLASILAQIALERPLRGLVLDVEEAPHE